MATAEQQHQAWRKLVPYLYDWFASHSLFWPSLACRWGPVLERGRQSNKQRLYLSEQTDGTEPNKIVLVNVDVVHPRVASSEHLQSFSERGKSDRVSAPLKTIVHPGEVNRMREVPLAPHVLITHTDSPNLYVWNTDTQPDRAGIKSTNSKQHSVADLILEGHTQDAKFAVDVSSLAPHVASGGDDTKVLIWDLDSHSTSLATSAASTAGPGSSTLLDPLHTLAGHTNTVEDVCWCPDSSSQLASVGDDYALLLWDTRQGTAPAVHIASAHGPQDVHCVAWSPHKQEMLVTGAADGTLKIWDRRKPASPIYGFHHHESAVTVVEWNPKQAGVFASAGEDRLLCVWDLANKGDPDSAPAKKQKSAVLPQMMFQHAGHRAPVVDFQWNPEDPWTLFSVADEAGEGGGGTLQLWRISDLIYRPDDEILTELEEFRDYIITGHASALQKRTTDGEGGGSEPLEGDGTPAGDAAAADGKAAAKS